MPKKRAVKKRKVRETRRDLRKENFLKALELSGGHIQNACAATQIHRSLIYDWMENDPHFELEINLIRDSKIDNVEAALYKGALEGNTIAQIFFLKTIGKSRGYVERHEVVDVTEVDFSSA